MRIDHVTLAGADLEGMRRCFADIGLATDYGGPHSNGITHMAQLAFDDGSYVELISTLTPGATSPLWDQQIRQSAGPAAWAVLADDLERERARLETAGIGVTGPVAMTRTRPDGTVLAWELLFAGDGPPGAMLPFSIRDRTSRSGRVSPSTSVTGGGIRGVAAVVIAVRELGNAAALFRRAYGWSEPSCTESRSLGARVAGFRETPVFLAEPADRSSWIRERLARYGESPAAFLLTGSSGRAGARLPLLPAEEWFGCNLQWIDPAHVLGWRLGLLSAAH